MQSLSFKKMNKKGNVVEVFKLVGAVMLVLFTLAIIFIAILLGMTSLQNANIFTANSASANATTNVVNNISAGGTNFFAQIPTIFTILGVVALIGAIVLIIYFISRVGGGSSSGKGGL